jgi:flavorubredoxin
MQSIELTNRVSWVGVKDPDLRVFDLVIKTAYGTTYNSYLLQGEKTALVDGVKRGFEGEFFAKIEEHLPIEKIDYLIVNHTEPDHSGAIPLLLERNHNIKLICSKPAVPFLRNIVNDETVEITGVKGGDHLDLDGLTLEFVSAPFMHWPDTMFTYCPEEGILFSCDGYGAHLSPTDGMFCKPGDKLVDHEVWYYYESIMRPFASFCRRASEAVIGRDIRILAPSHGPISRDEPKRFIQKYLEWTKPASGSGKKSVVVAFASSYGNTRLMAEEIDRTLAEKGLETHLVDLVAVSQGDLRSLFEQADAVILGSPTFNSDAVKPVWDAAQMLPTTGAIGKKGAAFGSYGWGGQAVELLESYLEGIKIKVFKPGVKARLTPSEKELADCKQFAEGFVQFMQEPAKG